MKVNWLGYLPSWGFSSWIASGMEAIDPRKMTPPIITWLRMRAILWYPGWCNCSLDRSQNARLVAEQTDAIVDANSWNMRRRSMFLAFCSQTSLKVVRPFFKETIVVFRSSSHLHFPCPGEWGCLVAEHMHEGSYYHGRSSALSAVYVFDYWVEGVQFANAEVSHWLHVKREAAFVKNLRVIYLRDSAVVAQLLLAGSDSAFLAAYVAFSSAMRNCNAIIIWWISKVCHISYFAQIWCMIQDIAHFNAKWCQILVKR